MQKTILTMTLICIIGIFTLSGCQDNAVEAEQNTIDQTIIDKMAPL